MATIALPSTRPSTRRMAVLLSFLLFIAVCASAAYWAMQLFKPPARPVAPAPQENAAPVNTAAAGSLFGGRAGDSAVASNYQLQGLVLASGLAGTSLIMSVDGKPAQYYRADREIAPGVTVKEVHPTYVLLSDNGVAKRVELPAELKPSTTAPVGRGNDARNAPARPVQSAPANAATTPPPRTMPPPNVTNNAGNAALQAQQAQQGQQVPPGTPVPAAQAPAVSSGASGTAGTVASGGGQQAAPAQNAQPAQQPVQQPVQQPAQVQQAVQQPAQVQSPAQGAVVHGGNQQMPGLAPLNR